MADERPRERMFRYLHKRIFTLGVWEELFTAEGRELYDGLKEEKQFLTDVRGLLTWLEQEEIEKSADRGGKGR